MISLDVTAISEFIGVMGFPIACACAMGFFIYNIYKRSVEREDLLYGQINDCREVNRKAIETITRYADRLDNIERDVSDIKTDVIKISDKISE